MTFIPTFQFNSNSYGLENLLSNFFKISIFLFSARSPSRSSLVALSRDDLTTSGKPKILILKLIPIRVLKMNAKHVQKREKSTEEKSAKKTYSFV